MHRYLAALDRTTESRIESISEKIPAANLTDGLAFAKSSGFDLEKADWSE
jgi:hypothetical protein